MSGGSDENGNRQGHTSLTSSTERCASNSVECEVLVGVGHDDCVVLGTKIGLHSLAEGGCPVVDVFTSLVATDKRDGFDVGVVADPVDRRSCTVYDVENSWGQTCRTSAMHRIKSPYLPARSQSSAMIMVAPGSRSEGLTINVLPVTVANAADHRTIMAGKLNGVIAAVTPSGNRRE